MRSAFVWFFAIMGVATALATAGSMTLVQNDDPQTCYIDDDGNVVCYPTRDVTRI